MPRFSDLLVFPSIGWGSAKAALGRAGVAGALDDPRPQAVGRDRAARARRVDKHPVDTHLVELIINHASGSRGGVAGVYDRSERLAERRRALERWADLVLRAAGEPVDGATVVNLR